MLSEELSLRGCQASEIVDYRKVVGCGECEVLSKMWLCSVGHEGIVYRCCRYRWPFTVACLECSVRFPLDEMG
jgi:hypothetical protein